MLGCHFVSHITHTYKSLSTCTCQWELSMAVIGGKLDCCVNKWDRGSFCTNTFAPNGKMHCEKV